jgi:hypothetical protein
MTTHIIAPVPRNRHEDDLTKSQAEQMIDRLTEAFRHDLAQHAEEIARRCMAPTLSARFVHIAANSLIDWRYIEADTRFGFSELADALAD